MENPGLNSCRTDISYAIDAIPRIKTMPVLGVLLALDLAGCSALAWALTSQGVRPQLAYPAQKLMWLAAPPALWLISAFAASLYSRVIIRAGHSQILPFVIASCLAFAPYGIVIGVSATGWPPMARIAEIILCQVATFVVTRGAWSAVLGRLLRHGYCFERVIILASSLSHARLYAANFEKQTRGKLRAAAYASVLGMQDADSMLWLESTVRSNGITKILVVADGGDGGLNPEMLIALARVRAEINFQFTHGSTGRLCVESDAGSSLHVPPAPLSAAQAGRKRLFDLVVSATALLLLAPLLFILACMIKLDSPGPVLFRQKRQGLHGKPFEMFKFRSMHHHMSDLAGVIQTTRNDTRVTRLGRFLRSTSFDELPQLLNVLRGEMSIVGPRPHALGMIVAGRPVAVALEGYDARHRLKPGITGWAQVNGSRGEVTGQRALRRRVALDCTYIQNWSLCLDTWIIIRTVMLIFRDKHAF